GHRQDLHWYLRQMEAVLIHALESLGIPAERTEGRTGVWTGGRKIASIGVHARDWVTWHGFALNVSNDLSYFDLIVPCGLSGVTMTSVERELGSGAPPFSAVAERVAASFGSVFTLEREPLAAEDLFSMLAQPC
ncbi:MAG TPA: lipoyl(octanoyl) transferase LipB, partial [Gemmatimonadaceae bacterium]